MSSSLTSQANCDIVRGPYMYSNINADLDVGDNISFDWQAIGGADAYDVFGFILDVNDGYSEIILDQYSNYNNRYTSWTTVTHQVSRKGDYKFVFVSGSYDATCGKALGSDLYIDNVKVYFSDNTTSTFCK